MKWANHLRSWPRHSSRIPYLEKISRDAVALALPEKRLTAWNGSRRARSRNSSSSAGILSLRRAWLQLERETFFGATGGGCSLPARVSTKAGEAQMVSLPLVVE